MPSNRDRLSQIAPRWIDANIDFASGLAELAVWLPVGVSRFARYELGTVLVYDLPEAFDLIKNNQIDAFIGSGWRADEDEPDTSFLTSGKKLKDIGLDDL